jgi:hypothetical protein
MTASVPKAAAGSYRVQRCGRLMTIFAILSRPRNDRHMSSCPFLIGGFVGQERPVLSTVRIRGLHGMHDRDQLLQTQRRAQHVRAFVYLHDGNRVGEKILERHILGILGDRPRFSDPSKSWSPPNQHGHLDPPLAGPSARPAAEPRALARPSSPCSRRNRDNMSAIFTLLRSDIGK